MSEQKPQQQAINASLVWSPGTQIILNQSYGHLNTSSSDNECSLEKLLNTSSTTYLIFSVAKVTLVSIMSVHLSEMKTPFRIIIISHHAHQPSRPLFIKPLSHHAYQQLCYGHHNYQQSACGTT